MNDVEQHGGFGVGFGRERSYRGRRIEKGGGDNIAAVDERLFLQLFPPVAPNLQQAYTFGLILLGKPPCSSQFPRCSRPS